MDQSMYDKTFKIKKITFSLSYEITKKNTILVKYHIFLIFFNIKKSMKKRR